MRIDIDDNCRAFSNLYVIKRGEEYAYLDDDYNLLYGPFEDAIVIPDFEKAHYLLDSDEQWVELNLTEKPNEKTVRMV